MAYQLDIPPNLSGSDITAMYQYLDAQLSTEILYVHLYGIYTGIVTITLWNIFTRKSWPVGRQVMVIAIILLFIVTTINVGFNWSYISSGFIDNGQSFYSNYSVLVFSKNTMFLGMGITGAISTIIADSTMIWRCWMVWGRRWPIVLLPIMLLISGIVLKFIDTYQGYTTGYDDALCFVLYLSFILATTIWCTALIIYRILTVGRASDGIGGGVGVYRHVIEVLIESSALYSVFLILLVAFEIHGDWAGYYIDAISGIVRGIAPTLLVGRVAAGHARSDDSWQGSIMSSLHFETAHSRNNGQPSLEEETLHSIMLDEDLEAQQGKTDRHEHLQTGSQEYLNLQNSVVLQDDLKARPESVGDRHGRPVGYMD